MAGGNKTLADIAAERKRGQAVASLGHQIVVSGKAAPPGSLAALAAERAAKTSGAPADSQAGAVVVPAKKKHGGGFLGTLGHVGHVVAEKADLAAHDIKSIPGGLIDLGQLEGHALAADARQAVHHPLQTQSLHDFLHGKPGSARAQLDKAERATVEASKQSLEHPGRDPFQTAMTVLPILSGGASVVARAGAAADAVSAASGAGKAAAAAKALAERPEMPPRLLKVDDHEVALHHSSRPLPRAVQAGYDKVLQHGLDTKPEGRIAAHTQKRIGASLDESARAQQRLRETPAGALDGAARRLKSKTQPGRGRVHQAALELTSVNTTPEQAAAYHAEQAAKLTAEAAKSEKPAPLLEAARRNTAVARLYDTVSKRGLLTRNEQGDVIVNAANHPDLARADVALAKVQGRGDEILARYKVRTPEQLAERVNAPARIREGASYEKPTPAKAGVPSQSLLKAQARVDRLQALHDRATTAAQSAADKKALKLNEGPRTPQQIEDARTRLATLEAAHGKALDKMANALFGPIDRGEVRFRTRNNAKATRQQAGVDRLGRKSGASSDKARMMPTLKAERRAKAENKILDVIAKTPDHPVAKQWATRIETIDRLREALNPLPGDPINLREPVAARLGSSVVGEKGVVAAPGSARANRIGGALSVAKEDLQRAQDAAAARVKPTGILGGETARPGRGFVSYATRQKKAPASPAAASSGSIVNEAKAPVTSKTFTGTGIEHGLVPEDVTGQAARHYRSVIRFVNTTERRNAAIRTGSDVRRSERDVLVKVPGEDHAKITQAVEEALGKSKPTVDDIAGLHAALDAYRAELIPGAADKFAADAQHPVGTTAADAAAARGLDAPEGYKWVDKGALGELAKPAFAPRGRIARSADNLNSAVTAATVYFKIGHIGTRVLTNAATNVLQGSARPVEIAKSVKLWDQLSHEDRLKALAASGQHGFDAMPHAGASIASRVAGTGARWWAKHADAPFRFNSIAYEARKAGFDTPAQFRDMLDKLENPHEHNLNAAETAKVEWVAKRANREGIAYDRLNDAEKRYLTRGLWFYPWIKGATVFAGNTLLEHPYKAAIAGTAGVEGRQAQQAELGDLPTYEGGLFQLKGGRKPLVADFSTFSPFATPADLLNTVARPSELSGMLNPAYGGVNAYINGLNRYGDKLSQGQNPLVEALATVVAPAPETQIVSGYLNRHKPQDKKMFPASPKLYGTLSPILRALIGPGLPRHMNTTAAHASAARQRSGR